MLQGTLLRRRKEINGHCGASLSSFASFDRLLFRDGNSSVSVLGLNPIAIADNRVGFEEKTEFKATDSPNIGKNLFSNRYDRLS